jgi:hypothetical protein
VNRSRSRLHAADCTEAREAEDDDENFSHFNFLYLVCTLSVQGINSRAHRSLVVSLQTALRTSIDVQPKRAHMNRG